MMQRNNVPSVTWPQFELCNSNPQSAFENMCRVLFNSFFFDGKAILHSDHNNPGIEVFPIKYEKSGKRISFQAKYFSTLDYSQIRHSAEMAIKYYKGELDVIYLYCNKDVTTTSQAYQGIKDLLIESGIDLIPITNQTILDQALLNDTIAWYYFDSHNLSNDWFKQNLDDSLSALGPRYNASFNVSTHSDEYLNLFLHNGSAVVQVNQRKLNVLSNLRENRWKYSEYVGIAKRICNAIESLPDITPESIQDCLSWNTMLSEKCESEFTRIQEIIAEKMNSCDIAREEKDYEKASRLYADIRDLKELLAIPGKVSLNAHERVILQKKVLVVLGDAGSGKSQLFANAANNGLKSGIPSVLLLGHTFLTKDAIAIQIPTQLQLDLSVDALLQKFEGIGQQLKTQICIFIDAINESGYKQIWMTGLPRLINQISKLDHVRLAISVRSGYEKLVFDNSIQEKIRNKEIASMVHTGFQEESVRATREFLNYYGIPFLPSYFLQTEMTNPLFLKLFCENYDGEEVDLFTLFDKVIKKSDEEAQQAVGIEYSTDLLKYLVNQIVEIRLEQGSLSITKEALFTLPFWNTYGLQEKKIPFMVSLERSGMLIAAVYDDEEIYYIGYNLLEDFLCAKQLMNRQLSKAELVNYFKDDLLEITNGAISKYENQDIFIVACGLYAEKYGEECINSIVECITDEHDLNDLVHRFIMSFRWRRAKSIDGRSFVDMARKLRVNADVLFRVLIECSTKKGHPLNADMLHSLLFPMRLSQRDYVWTTYINGLSNEEERVFQLIDQFNHGEMLDRMSEDNMHLLLTLFTWLLTSSNRRLRDIASKASVELLKNKFSLCLPLLRRFETVNDPYVIQRLFGVIFGACMKRVNKDRSHFRELAEHIYQTVFNQDNVYPDVLLRDYARLIVQRWIYENPDDCEFIDQIMIYPPYRSTAIPAVERQTYYQQGDNHRGFNAIEISMSINHKECPGMYGDFGRYTFQSLLDAFKDVDVVAMYHYAMQYIRDELGYDDELFGDYDTSFIVRSYNRHTNRKVERIGKKYQWIALYNILARLSDSHQISRWDEEPRTFEGSWNPYIRDFDPTLNCHFLHSDLLPEFNYPEFTEELFLEIEPFPSKCTISDWNQGDTMFYSSLNSKLMFNDKDGNTWIALKLYECQKNKHHDIDGPSVGFAKGSQEIWHMEQGLFMEKEEFEKNRQYLQKTNYTGRHFPEGKDVYQLFNREYAWSSGIESVFGNYWFDHEIEIGGKRKEKQIRQMPKFVHHENGEITIEFGDVECEIDVPEEVVTLHILPAFSRVLWEAEYDASQEETTSFDIPCKQVINYLKLEQRKYDGYFYCPDGKLVCFDGDLCGPCDGLLIRKDYLDKFLDENELVLFWTSIGEKQFFFGDHSQAWSEWSGFFEYDGKQVIGRLECMGPKI